MKTFLSIVARDLINRFGGKLHDVTIVFPGKRASLFLTQELVNTGTSPLWEPEYISMDHLFQEFTTLTQADTIESICTLIRLMQEIIPEEREQSLDQLWGWGEVILSDFDDIDKHMADARLVLANVYDQHCLDNIDYLTPEQEEALNKFFGNFSIEGNTAIKERFLHIWRHMHTLYNSLRETLETKGKFYPGALYRQVVNQIRQHPESLEQYLDKRKAVVFVGFNVLNDVEQALMQEIQRSGKGLFYWDYDTFYTDDEANEAGTFMRQNLQDFPCAIGKENFQNLRNLKDVTFISCNSDNASARYTRQWLSEALDIIPNRNAVVLCNESLLHPVLHALPEQTGDVNVTMGFPLADTPVHSLLMALINLQTDGYDKSKQTFRYSFLQAVRRHAYVRLLGEETEWACTWQGTDSPTLLTWLDKMLQRIGLYFSKITQPSAYDMLYMEAVFQTHRILQQFINLTQAPEDALEVHPITLRKLMRSIFVSTRIPFHGEPAVGLQIMGVLETRCLDFSHLLMLSVEEGMLPRSTQTDTMIPADIREAFGLTTPRHRNAVFAYYFYRLIQRTEHLTCVYNENSNGNTHHEMSRFLRQMLAETDIPIHSKWLRSIPQISNAKHMCVQKDESIMKRLQNKYDASQLDKRHVMLSPSAINIYIDCPMKFYFQHVAGLQPERDLEEGVQPADLGNIFHDTAQILYELTMERTGSRILGSNVINELLRQAKSRVEPLLDIVFDAHIFHPYEDKWNVGRHIRDMAIKGINPQNEYTGELIIYRSVILQYLKNMLKYDAQHAPLHIIGTEVERKFTLNIHPKGMPPMTIETGGRIDRLDEVNGCVRVVDYKTGNKLPSIKSIEEATGMSKKHEGYYTQTFLYAYAQMKQSAPGTIIKPLLFYPVKASNPQYSPELFIGDTKVEDFSNQVAEEFMDGLKERITEIFTPDISFTQCDDPSTCEKCDFRLICLGQE